MNELTKSQGSALKWLYNRGGSGIFNKNNVLMAKGELAGVMRSTWNALRDRDFVTFDAKRVLITEIGICAAKSFTHKESDTVEDDI